MLGSAVEDYSRCAVCQGEPSTSACSCIQNPAAQLESKACVEIPSPIEIVNSPVHGNCVIASRDIKAGELIFCERPFLMAPGPPVHRLSLCLACCKEVTPADKCSTCLWPVCGSDCENNEIHALNECEVLARNSVKRSRLANDYFSVEALRCLRMRETSPEKWERILTFESHQAARGRDRNAQESLQFIKKFIRDDCALVEYDEEVIEHVVGLLYVNTFSCDNHIQTTTSVLFDKASLLSHDCHPNTDRRMLELSERSFLPSQDYYASNSKIEIEIRANRLIKKGEMITTSYLDQSLPVNQRRRKLKEAYYFDCNCLLCKIELMEQWNIFWYCGVYSIIFTIFVAFILAFFWNYIFRVPDELYKS